MSEISQECRTMAAQMLDAELMAILRKLKEGDELTQLQNAVLVEIEKRRLISRLPDFEQSSVLRAPDTMNGTSEGRT